VAVARRHGAFVVEDDFARQLAHTDAGPAPDPLAADDDDGVVVHIRSLTKSTSPNLRIGVVAARGPVLDRLRAALVVDNFFVARPLQEAALELVSAPAWPRHLRQLGRALGSRQAAALRAIHAAFGETAVTRRPTGGFHLWLTLPADCRDTDVARAALRLGVAVMPGRAYFPSDAPTNHVRLSYCAAPTEPAIAEGVALLARAANESTRA
jgi:DNA-binding transcriptional MocR family regulator